jgi:TerC family integral membrane protein
MLHVTAQAWAATLALIAALLVLDWVLLGRRRRAIGTAEAARLSLFYVAIAVAFGAVFTALEGATPGAQFFTGYVVEESLSIDNLFVFLIILGALAVPAAQQPKALSVGITLALVLRAVFIALGAALIELFSFMFAIFGVALIVTAVQLFRHRDQDPEVSDNVFVSTARRLLPVSNGYEGSRLVTRREGQRVLTPLFLVLVAIGTADVMFAFDSIPAVFGVSRHAYIVFVANAFALLGLRPLFFLVAGLLDRLVYLSTGLAAVLAFIGVKLVLESAHDQDHAIPQISTGLSLAVVAAILAATVLASLLRARRDPELRAHAGSLREAHHGHGPPVVPAVSEPAPASKAGPAQAR